ncbi:MAG: hypothetical protein H7Y06_00780, partial [Opitutaceae bacterium]|nr:hypothetical protein [Opitutaceae bacterium]
MRALWSYWFHFAIMFEALFILTTIDAGTRIGRFLFQEVAGKIHPKFGQADWWPGAVVSTAVVVAAWAWFMNSDSFATIWKMFGIGNQMLAVIALAIVSAFLVREGKRKYLWVTIAPMAVVMTTTGTSAAIMLAGLVQGIVTQLGNPSGKERNTLLFNSTLQAIIITAMVVTAAIVIVSMARKVWGRGRGGDDAASAFPVLQPAATG